MPRATTSRAAGEGTESAAGDCGVLAVLAREWTAANSCAMPAVRAEWRGALVADADPGWAAKVVSSSPTTAASTARRLRRSVVMAAISDERAVGQQGSYAGGAAVSRACTSGT